MTKGKIMKLATSKITFGTDLMMQTLCFQNKILHDAGLPISMSGLFLTGMVVKKTYHEKNYNKPLVAVSYSSFEICA